MNKLLTTILVAGATVSVMGCSAQNSKQSDQKMETMTQHQSEATNHSGMVNSEADDGVPQKTCPVMGGVINKDLYVDYEGKRIYLCCQGCVDPVKKDPEKYLKKLEEMGEKPGSI